MQQYDTAALWREASRRSARLVRRQKRRIRLALFLKDAQQRMRRPFCRHLTTRDMWYRDHPDHYWLTGHRCVACDHVETVQPPQQIMQPQRQEV